MQLLPLEKFTVTPYRISTMTVTGSIDSVINLKVLFDNIDIDKFKNIKYVEYGASKTEQCFKGNKEKKPKKKVTQIKRFDNQMTLHITDDLYKYNLKLFKNGNLQMTGVKDIEKGKLIVDELINIIKNINNNHDDSVTDDDNKLINKNYSTRLINCDFKVNFKIHRTLLHKLLIDKYKLACSYEPCIYQGVKVSFYLNDYSHDGICSCEKKCIGKGKNTYCKKVTIAIFQSGCITITGSDSIERLNYVYEYIVNILRDNINEIHQQTYVLKSN